MTEVDGMMLPTESLRQPMQRAPAPSPEIVFRYAVAADAPRLQHLIERSVRGLQAGDYSSTQIDAALGYIFGVDDQLIADGTYYIAETGGDGHEAARAVACGGWSRRRTLFGAQAHAARDDASLVPGVEPARIRAFFVDPDWARRGLARRLLGLCEAAAAGEGFGALELGATLTGEPFYRQAGYVEVERQAEPLPTGEALTIVRMRRRLPLRSTEA